MFNLEFDMTKTLHIIDCKQGFEYQGPRFGRLGANSGEEFRDNFLIPFLTSISDCEIGVIDFSGTKVYTTSFLEESDRATARQRLTRCHSLIVSVELFGKGTVTKWSN